MAAFLPGNFKLPIISIVFRHSEGVGVMVTKLVFNYVKGNLLI